MQFTNLPSESDAYRQAREELRLAEVDLMAHRERVAELRRALPAGPAVPDYEFVEGAADLASRDDTVAPVTLSELFSGPDRPLIVYHFMFGKQQQAPCPMCTMWIDGFSGIARHVQESADFVVVAAAEPGALRRHARSRGWQGLRLLSAGACTFKYDLGSEDAQGVQDSRVSVFTATVTGPSATATRVLPAWLTTSTNGASTCSAPPGTCWTSPRTGGTTGMPRCTTRGSPPGPRAGRTPGRGSRVPTGAVGRVPGHG